MLQIIIELTPEAWDEQNQMFVEPKTKTLQLEHSLVSISKWESIWRKSFFSSKEKTYEESIDYIRCMTITQNVDPSIYSHLSDANMRQITDYIESPMSATYFNDDKKRHNSREAITSEIIYYWMVALNIPFECQKWHINRLLALIRVCDIKNSPPKKMGKRELMNKHAAINAARRQQLNAKG